MKHFKKLAVICFITSIIFFKFFIQDLFCLSLFWDKQSIWNSLILFGAEINGKNLNGTTPLQFSLVSSFARILGPPSTDAFEFLVKNGGDVNEQDERGRTPLFYAVNNSNLDFSVIELLIKSGATINYSDSAGTSLFSEAVRGQWGYPEGGILDIEDRRKAKKNKTHLLMFLISNGLYLFQKDKEGKTPLHWAMSTSIGSVTAD